MALSFGGGGAPTVGNPYSTGAQLSYGSNIPKTDPVWGWTQDMDSFMASLSMGTPIQNMGPDNIGGSGSTVVPAPSVDGTSSTLSGLTNVATAVLGYMGSTGDGQVTPVAYQTQGESGGISPSLILMGALAVGAVYFIAKK
ncbi:hypothetical protein [uncultured Celeribacter sp.]|uniref:hypothetical protein n=1 Tax=uncultured Celeribacter sp. TaxID=1303376 RepID=UPI002AA6FBD2|nr:hypothetical protein [uncultured Celeribacter sp.]